MFIGIRRRTNSHHITLNHEETHHKNKVQVEKNMETKRLSLKTLHHQRYSNDHKQPPFKQQLKNNPDIYFKPKVKNHVYRSIMDIYFEKEKMEKGEYVKKLPTLNLDKNIHSKLGIAPYLKKKSQINSRKLPSKKPIMKIAERQIQQRKKNTKKPIKMKIASFQSITNQLDKKLPIIKESKKVQSVLSARKRKRSTTVWSTLDNNDRKNHVRHRSDISISSLDDSFESSLGIFDQDSPGIRGRQRSGSPYRSLSRNQSNPSLMRKTQNIVNGMRLRKNLGFNTHKKQNSLSQKNQKIPQKQTYLTNIYRIQLISENKEKRYYSKTFLNEENCDQKSYKMINVLQKVSRLGINQFWKKTIVENEKDKIIYTAPLKSSLRHELFNFKIDEKVVGEEIIKIIPKKAYFDLFENQCEFFIDIVRSVVGELKKVGGKVINNMISLENLYRMGEKDIRIGDWGCSAIREELKINGQNIEHKNSPILKDELGWLVTPQSLPPEILKLMIEEKYTDIWNQEGSPEVWSIGVMIFQLLYMIPVWMPSKAGYNKKIPRKGLFYSAYRQLEKILQLQQRIPLFLSKWLREQKELIKGINPKIIKIMRYSLHPNPSKRLTLQQILSFLS